MAEHEAREVRLEDDEERNITIKISLEGPAELVSWLRENRPDKLACRVAEILPRDFRQHMKAARREQLLALRSLLDAAIARGETEEKPSRRAMKVEID